MHHILALMFLLFGSPLLLAGTVAQSETHTGVLATKHFAVRYRPGSTAGAFVEREAARAERDLADICAALGLELQGRYQLYLYDDIADLSQTTKTSGNTGFSAGDASHIPVGNDQTRFHELVHIIVFDRLKKSGDEARNLFFAEALSNALLVHVHGVHVHSVARWYLDKKALPALAEMTAPQDFYDWLSARPGFNAYDVGGSYFRFLLDTYGATKTARYYSGASAKVSFGVDEAKLERAWRETLAKYELRPEVQALLTERHGDSAQMMLELAAPPGLSADLLGAPADWKSLLDQPLRAASGAEWKRTKLGIVGKSGEAGWSVCELGSESYADCVVRAVILSERPTPIQIRLGAGNQAMLVNGTFLYRNDQAQAHSPRASIGEQRKRTELVLVRRAGKVEVWVDGRRCLSTDADPQPSPVGIAFHQGEIVFEEVGVRVL
jgi:hypothetical protein